MTESLSTTGSLVVEKEVLTPGAARQQVFKRAARRSANWAISFGLYTGVTGILAVGAATLEHPKDVPGILIFGGQAIGGGGVTAWHIARSRYLAYAGGLSTRRDRREFARRGIRRDEILR